MHWDRKGLNPVTICIYWVATVKHFLFHEMCYYGLLNIIIIIIIININILYITTIPNFILQNIKNRFITLLNKLTIKKTFHSNTSNFLFSFIFSILCESNLHFTHVTEKNRKNVEVYIQNAQYHRKVLSR